MVSSVQQENRTSLRSNILYKLFTDVLSTDKGGLLYSDLETLL